MHLLRLRIPGTPARKLKANPDEERTGLTLMDLPPEIHLLISKHLIYPDALSLKHTNRHFYCLVNTGVRLKVEWLVERRSLHLECPNDHRCDLGSDLRFCRGSVPYVYCSSISWVFFFLPLLKFPTRVMRSFPKVMHCEHDIMHCCTLYFNLISQFVFGRQAMLKEKRR